MSYFPLGSGSQREGLKVVLPQLRFGRSTAADELMRVCNSS